MWSNGSGALSREADSAAPARYTDAMIRFTLRELFFAVTLVAVGAALLRLGFSNGGLSDIRPQGPARALFCWFAGGMSIGAAITGLWRRDWILGVGAGLAVQFILLLVLSGAY